MPKNTIASTFVDNGPGDQANHILRVSWGAKGDAPEAPRGWVNAGYAHLAITKEVDVEDSTMTEQVGEYWVELDSASMDHLIRTLKRIRRATFDK